MTPNEEYEERKKKILSGLDLAFEQLLEYKKYKKTDLVVMRNGKIMHIKPEDFYKETSKKPLIK